MIDDIGMHYDLEIGRIPPWDTRVKEQFDRKNDRKEFSIRCGDNTSLRINAFKKKKKE